VHGIQLVEDLLHEPRDQMRDLRVHNGVLAIRVKQHFIQAPLNGVRSEELRSLRFDRLFKTSPHSNIICRSHVILLFRVAGEAFGGVSSTVGRRFSRFRTSDSLPPAH
jgi:hypothetical protein